MFNISVWKSVFLYYLHHTIIIIVIIAATLLQCHLNLIEIKFVLLLFFYSSFSNEVPVFEPGPVIAQEPEDDNGVE